jgi:hypothetical protein
LQQISFRQIHLEDGVKLVVPHVRFRAYRHGERDELFQRRIRDVGQHALEITDRFEDSDVVA